MPFLPARHRAVLAMALSPLFGVGVCAQATWVVDQSNGPGAQFTSLAPAIATAADGDVIIVRPGAYLEGHLDVDKGLTILGEPGAELSLNVFGTAGMTVRDLPATSSFAMRGLHLGGQLADPAVDVVDCDGLVLLDQLRGPIGGLGLPENFGVYVDNCRQVHLHDLWVRGGKSLRIENTHATVTQCAFDGGIAGVVRLVDSDVTFDRCAISIEPTVSFAPSLTVDGGAVTLARSSVAAPTSTQTPHPAISTLGNVQLRIDPTVLLTPTAGQLPVAGPAQVSYAEVDTMSRSGKGIITFDLQGRSGSLFITFVTLPSSPTSWPFGTMWLDPNPATQISIGAGVVTTRQQTFPLDTSVLPLGLQFVAQTGILDPSFTLALTNGLSVIAN